MIFDGDDLPAKKVTESSRATSRVANLKAGTEALLAKDYVGARQFLSKAVDITPRMAAQLIQVLKQRRPKVKCVVAPYEADAQLSFMCRAGLVDAILSEDSDTIPYGCKEVLFKFNPDEKCCETILLSDIYQTFIPRFDLREFNGEMMIALCVGAGCDYLESVKGFGLKNSYNVISKQKTVPKMLRNMRLKGLVPLVPAPVSVQGGKSGLLEYEYGFYKAVATFRHQTVFDVTRRMTCHLTEVNPADLPPCLHILWDGDADLRASLAATAATSSSFSSSSSSCSSSFSSSTPSSSPAPAATTSSRPLGAGFDFLGAALPSALACAIADGLVDPTTKLPFDFSQPVERPLREASLGGVQGSLLVRAGGGAGGTVWGLGQKHQKSHKAGSGSSGSGSNSVPSVRSFFHPIPPSSASAIATASSAFAFARPFSAGPTAPERRLGVGALAEGGHELLTGEGSVAANKPFAALSSSASSFSSFSSSSSSSSSSSPSSHSSIPPSNNPFASFSSSSSTTATSSTSASAVSRYRQTAAPSAIRRLLTKQDTVYGPPAVGPNTLGPSVLVLNTRHPPSAHDPSAHDPSAHDPSVLDPSAHDPSPSPPRASATLASALPDDVQADVGSSPASVWQLSRPSSSSLSSSLAPALPPHSDKGPTRPLPAAHRQNRPSYPPQPSLSASSSSSAPSSSSTSLYLRRVTSSSSSFSSDISIAPSAARRLSLGGTVGSRDGGVGTDGTDSSGSGRGSGAVAASGLRVKTSSGFFKKIGATELLAQRRQAQLESLLERRQQVQGQREQGCHEQRQQERGYQGQGLRDHPVQQGLQRLRPEGKRERQQQGAVGGLDEVKGGGEGVGEEEGGMAMERGDVAKREAENEEEMAMQKARDGGDESEGDDDDTDDGDGERAEGKAKTSRQQSFSHLRGGYSYEDSLSPPVAEVKKGLFKRLSLGGSIWSQTSSQKGPEMVLEKGSERLSLGGSVWSQASSQMSQAPLEKGSERLSEGMSAKDSEELVLFLSQPQPQQLDFDRFAFGAVGGGGMGIVTSSSGASQHDKRRSSSSGRTGGGGGLSGSGDELTIDEGNVGQGESEGRAESMAREVIPDSDGEGSAREETDAFLSSGHGGSGGGGDSIGGGGGDDGGGGSDNGSGDGSAGRKRVLSESCLPGRLLSEGGAGLAASGSTTVRHSHGASTGACSSSDIDEGAGEGAYVSAGAQARAPTEAYADEKTIPISRGLGTDVGAGVGGWVGALGSVVRCDPGAVGAGRSSSRGEGFAAEAGTRGPKAPRREDSVATGHGHTYGSVKGKAKLPKGKCSGKGAGKGSGKENNLDCNIFDKYSFAL